MPPTSTKNSPCLYCGKLLTARGVCEHERHHCKKNPNRVKRSFGKKRCVVCGKKLNAAGHRAHMATQHPLEFAKEKARKPSSRVAKRRELYARAKESSAPRAVPARRKSERDASVAQSTRDHRASPHWSAAPVDTTVAKPRSWSQPDKPSEGHATRRAWADMKKEMSRAVAM